MIVREAAHCCDKIDRIARNLEDHAMIRAALRSSGARLVSATEANEDTPSGQMLEGILAVMSEYYSSNLAQEIKKGMHQKIKMGGSTAGHNGLESLVRAFRSPDFFRVRMGIGRPPGRQDPADFVLQPFAAREREDAAIMVEDAADAVVSLVTDGLEAAQARFNRTPKA